VVSSSGRASRLHQANPEKQKLKKSLIYNNNNLLNEKPIIKLGMQ
jgi:hypothetical protein